MRSLFRILTLFFAALLTLPALAQQNADWTTPVRAFRIADNLFYVGSRDLAAFLVTTPEGNILINANLESSPPLIRASVERLGFKWEDTKILLDSQAHFDHMAGAAQVIRETHAKNFVMDGDADVSESGGATDFAHLTRFPPAHVDRILHDGDKVTLGGVTLVAHKTAGHTKGCTTWTMQVHVPGEPAGKFRNVVIVGGWAALDDYRLVDKPGKPASYPGIAADFEHAFETFHALPCDIFLGAHGIYFGMITKLQRFPGEGESVWIDSLGYKLAIDEREASFKRNLAKQQAAP